MNCHFSVESLPVVRSEIKKYCLDACRQLVEEAGNCTGKEEVKARLNEFRRQHSTKPIIDQSLIAVDSPVKDKYQAIRALVDKLFVDGRVDDANALETDVWAREEVYSTGLGYGIAIPHCKSSNVLQNSIAVLKLSEPVEWGSIDDKPVQIVILLAINANDAAQDHMKIFAKLARKIMHEDFRDNLQAISQADQLALYLNKTLEL